MGMVVGYFVPDNDADMWHGLVRGELASPGRH